MNREEVAKNYHKSRINAPSPTGNRLKTKHPSQHDGDRDHQDYSLVETSSYQTGVLTRSNAQHGRVTSMIG